MKRGGKPGSQDPTTEPVASAPAEPAPAESTADDVTTPIVGGFTNIHTTQEGVVQADFAYTYEAPARGDVHITSGPRDRSPDSDQDGLSDNAEKKFGTNPHDYDSDRDGLADGVEVQIGSDPLNKLGDADHDGVTDATEIGHGMNPFDSDTDHDGLSDAEEYDRWPGLAVISTPGSTDTDFDGDGISNDTELTWGGSITIPEKDIPEFQAVRDLDYEVRQQLNTDPVHQAMVADGFDKELTPEQEGALLDAVFERGIAGDIWSRYTLALQLDEIDGTGVPPELQAEYDAAVAARDQAVLDSLPTASISDTLAASRGIALGMYDSSLQAAVDARLTVITDLANQVLTTGDPAAMLLLQAALPGTTLTTDVLTSITIEVAGQISTGYGTQPTGTVPAGSDATSPTTTQANDALDRMETLDASRLGAGFDDPAAPSPTTDSGGSTDDAVGGGAVDDVTSPASADPVEFTADNTPSQVADSISDWADGVAGSLGGDGSGSSQAPPPANIDMGAMAGGDIEAGFGTTSRGTTEDGRSYTETDLGEAGSKREYDDTGTIQFFNTDGTPKGGEMDPHSDAGSDGTNPYDGTTDDDETTPDDSGDADGDGGDDGELDGTSGEGVAYVNPDADVITAGLSPVTAQIILTGNDPATTTPSTPYVDDDAAPIVVSTGVVAVGVDVPMNPGVTDGGGVESVGTGVPLAFDPAGPDVIGPDDPLLGGGGEDINVGDFTPRPSAARSGLMGDGPADDGFDGLDLP